MEGLATSDSCGWAGNFLLAKLRKKIKGFRGILELPPCIGSIPMNELLMGMVEDLQKLYPNSIPCPSLSQTNMTSIFQGLCHFYEALKSVGDSCAKTPNGVKTSVTKTMVLRTSAGSNSVKEFWRRLIT